MKMPFAPKDDAKAAAERQEKKKRTRALTVLPARGALAETSPAERTFVIFGVPRGGTSAVAGTLMRLGVDMGENLRGNHEDRDFVEKDLAHMKAAIAARNASKPVWGWKYPEAIRYLEDLVADLRNPELILVCRDPAALMMGHVRWHNREAEEALEHALTAQLRNVELVQRLGLRTAVVSYEKAMVFPRHFTRQLARFAGLEAPKPRQLDQIATFLEAGSYKSAQTADGSEAKGRRADK